MYGHIAHAVGLMRRGHSPMGLVLLNPMMIGMDYLDLPNRNSNSSSRLASMVVNPGRGNRCANRQGLLSCLYLSPARWTRVCDATHFIGMLGIRDRPIPKT